MTLRTVTLAAVLGFTGTACISPYLIHTPQEDTAGITADETLTMRADPNAWSALPFDLEGHLTPISIEIVSRHPADIRISYSDFAMIDQAGLRYPVISPFRSGVEPPSEPARQRSPAPKAAAPIASPPIGTQPSSPRRGNDGLDDSWLEENDAAQQGIHWRWSPEEIPLVGNEPLARQGEMSRSGHGRGPYVDSWNEHHYPQAPSYDELRLGLVEGTLSRGQRLSGFLYFQKAASDAGRLELTWTARTRDGKTVATLKVPLLVDASIAGG